MTSPFYADLIVNMIVTEMAKKFDKFLHLGVIRISLKGKSSGKRVEPLINRTN